MTNGTVNDYAPIQCLLEMQDDRSITVIPKAGCSMADVHDMLRLLTLTNGHFEHLTIAPEDDP